ncbi:MAG: pirin family protein [Myxococcota bacterium]|nr:pirin family protein [Myxococcota bacterium]
MSDDVRKARRVRAVERVVQAHQTLEGGGFPVRRPVPNPGMEQVDPFLLIDEMGPVDWEPGCAIGAPDHPHRGFETITYLLEGETVHRDSEGNSAVLGPGDVQWMTAGDGVIHSEMPTDALRESGGRVHGFQLWVNLPAEHKRMRPRYQDLSAGQIVTTTSADGRCRVRLIAGSALGSRAPTETVVDVQIHHWSLKAGGEVEVDVPARYNVLLYVFQGSIQSGEHEIGDGQMAILGSGDVVSMTHEGSAVAELLLLAGVPIEEPMARWGPFVMNTMGEIREAVADYQAGRMGRVVQGASGGANE